MSTKIWSFAFTLRAPRRIFISWKSFSLSFFTVNFDKNIRQEVPSLLSMIMGSIFLLLMDAIFMTWWFLERSFRLLWLRFSMPRRSYVWTGWLSATIISWIRALRSMPAHPIIHDITLLLRGCVAIIMQHVYWKTWLDGLLYLLCLVVSYEEYPCSAPWYYSLWLFEMYSCYNRDLNIPFNQKTEKKRKLQQLMVSMWFFHGCTKRHIVSITSPT